MNIKGYFSKDYLKKHRRKVILYSAFSLWGIYILWAFGVATRTVLMESIPVWETHIVTGLVVGLVFACRMKSRVDSRMEVVSFFIEGAIIGSMSVLFIYAVYVYLVPSDIVHYKSEYEVTTPGPVYKNRFRCEKGLNIKDVYTRKWFKFCKGESELDNEIKHGMNAVWVTARINKFGTYIIDYKFISESERNYLMNSGAEISI